MKLKDILMKNVKFSHFSPGRNYAAREGGRLENSGGHACASNKYKILNLPGNISMLLGADGKFPLGHTACESGQHWGGYFVDWGERWLHLHFSYEQRSLSDDITFPTYPQLEIVAHRWKKNAFCLRHVHEEMFHTLHSLYFCYYKETKCSINM